MPLVRSTGDIPAQIEQEASFIDNRGAGGDAVTPNDRIDRPRRRMQARREASEQRNVKTYVRQFLNDSLREFREEIGTLITDTVRNLSMGNLQQISQDRQSQQTYRENRDEYGTSAPNRLVELEND